MHVYRLSRILAPFRLLGILNNPSNPCEDESFKFLTKDILRSFLCSQVMFGKQQSASDIHLSPSVSDAHSISAKLCTLKQLPRLKP